MQATYHLGPQLLASGPHDRTSFDLLQRAESQVARYVYFTVELNSRKVTYKWVADLAEE